MLCSVSTKFYTLNISQLTEEEQVFFITSIITILVKLSKTRILWFCSVLETKTWIIDHMIDLFQSKTSTFPTRALI